MRSFLSSVRPFVLWPRGWCSRSTLAWLGSCCGRALAFFTGLASFGSAWDRAFGRSGARLGSALASRLVISFSGTLLASVGLQVKAE